jgi:hypothetical protein
MNLLRRTQSIDEICEAGLSRPLEMLCGLDCLL